MGSLKTFGVPFDPDAIVSETQEKLSIKLSTLDGSVPVHVTVSIEQYFLPTKSSQIGSAVLFGVDSTPYMIGRMKIVDARSNKLFKDKVLINSQYGLVDQFVETTRILLLKNTAGI